MPTRKTSGVLIGASAVKPGTSFDPAQHVSSVCPDIPAMSSAPVLSGAINNTLGRGRVRVTAPMGTGAHVLWFIGTIFGVPMVHKMAISGPGTFEGPDDSTGAPMEFMGLSQIEPRNAMGAPVAPGGALKIDWLRPGCAPSVDASQQAFGIYPGEQRMDGQPNTWLSIQTSGDGQAVCKGGWAAGDRLVTAAGGLRKRAAMEAANVVTLGTATSAAVADRLGRLSLEL